ncbi:MAG TPA: response regulator [Elusimicrobiales bacterium]|nr:response regulator [Elusimicrobiales bacterium]
MATFLAVDDDEDVLVAVKTILEARGHTVETATDKGEGMRLALSGRHDLLILDVMMAEPDDGIALAQDLRKAGFKKPILMMSNISKVSGFDYSGRSEVVPVDGFLEKPVSPKVLMAKVEALLKGVK